MPEFAPRDLRPRMHLPEMEQWVRDKVRTVTKRDVDKKTRHLVRYLNAAFFNRRPHKEPTIAPVPGYSDRQLRLGMASAFKERNLKKGLGGSTGDYKRYMRLFWDFAETGGYSKTGKLTRAYFLNENTQAALTDFWRNDRPGQVVDGAGHELRASGLPSNGIIRTSYSHLSVPSLISLDVGEVERVIASEEERGGRRGEKLPATYAPRHVLALRWLYWRSEVAHLLRWSSEPLRRFR